jgi:hypothetical protein
MPVPLVRCVDDRGCGHDTRFEPRCAALGKSQFHRRCARDIEIAFPPIGTGIVDAHYGCASVARISDQQNGAVRENRACRAVGFIRSKRLAGGRQSARVGRITPAIIVVGRFHELIAANEGDHFLDAQHPVAHAIEAISLAGGFRFRLGRAPDCQKKR